MKSSDKSEYLRKRAEELLANKQNLKPLELSKSMEELVESLQIYQFELEIQNDELIRLQQSLEESKSRFEKLFSNAPVAYCILNLDGVIQDANRAFLSLVNADRIESVGKHLNRFIYEQCQDDFYLHLRKAKSSSQGYTSNLVINSSEAKVYIKLHTQIEQLNNKEESVILCTLNNITNEINYQNDLSLSEQRFRSLVTSLDDVVFTLDTQQRHTGVYGNWIERLNQKPSDYIGRTSEEIFGKELAQIHKEHNSKALQGKNVVYEWNVESSEGRLYFQTSLSPIFDSKNNVIGIAGVGRDITILKKAQIALTERHKELNCLYRITSLGNDSTLMLPRYIEQCIEIIPSGFTNPNSTVVRITIGSNVYQSAGFRETPYSLSDTIVINNEPIGRIEIFCLNQKCLESEEHFGKEEKNLLNAIADHLSHIIKRGQDTDEISQQYVQLQKLNAEKDRLFSVIGHDLRGPLSTILGIADILERKEGSLSQEKSLALVQGIKKTATNVYQLLENLLEWARLQKGELQFSPEKLNLSNLVKGIVEFYNEHSQAKEIKTISKVDSNLNVWVDENMVKSILRNLLSNAIKFTNKNGEISILARNIEDGMVEVSVADNGIGMDSEILNNLFRIECNIGREGTNNEPSSGLGLLLCKEFVEKNNGKIWAESQEGKGSTFFFTLPSKPFTLGK